MTDLTAITTVLGCLDGEPRESLMRHGGPYEVFSVDGWRHAPDDPTDWSDCYAYRVKPAPPREFWITLYDGMAWDLEWQAIKQNAQFPDGGSPIIHVVEKQK